MAKETAVTPAKCYLAANAGSAAAEAGRWVVLASHANSEFVRAEPFDAEAIDLAALWADAGGDQR